MADELNYVNFITGSRPQFDELQVKDNDTLYFLEDTKQIFKGETNVTEAVEVLQMPASVAEFEAQLKTDGVPGKLYICQTHYVNWYGRKPYLFYIVDEAHNVIRLGTTQSTTPEAAPSGNGFNDWTIYRSALDELRFEANKGQFYLGTAAVGSLKNLQLTSVAHNVTYDQENLQIKVPQYGKDDVLITLPRDNFVHSGRYESDYLLPDGTYGPALVLEVKGGTYNYSLQILKVKETLSLPGQYGADEEAGKYITLRNGYRYSVVKQWYLANAGSNSIHSDGQDAFYDYCEAEFEYKEVDGTTGWYCVSPLSTDAVNVPANFSDEGSPIVFNKSFIPAIGDTVSIHSGIGSRTSNSLTLMHAPMTATLKKSFLAPSLPHYDYFIKLNEDAQAQRPRKTLYGVVKGTIPLDAISPLDIQNPAYTNTDFDITDLLEISPESELTGGNYLALRSEEVVQEVVIPVPPLGGIDWKPIGE